MDNIHNWVIVNECALCGRNSDYTTLVEHHISRRINGDKVIWLCSEPHPYFGISCHQRAHLDISLAKKLGIYDEIKTKLNNKNNG